MKQSWLCAALVVLMSGSAFGDSLGEDRRVADALRLLELWLDAHRAYEDIPALAAAVVHDQELLWSGAFGFADRERQLEARPETLYSICSISKLFTSIAALQLRDAGKLRLDDPLEEILPWFIIEQQFADVPPITLRGILTHSSGLPRESDFPYWTGPDFEFPSRDEVKARLPQQRTLYPPSTYFQYSNLGLTLAGEAVAHVSGESYDEYVRRHILDPLALDSTSPEIPAVEHGSRLATGYGAHKRSGERQPLTVFQVRGIAPAAGFASTVLDLARFASWQFRLLEAGGTEVLAASTLREMHRVHWIDPDWETTWGLGFAVQRQEETTFVSHGGGCPGFRSHFLLQPESKIAIVVMTNAIDAEPNPLTTAAYRLVKAAVDATEESPAAEPRSSELERYAGTYENYWGGEIAVLPWKEGLGLVPLPTDDPGEALTELRRETGDTFRRVRDDGTLGEEIRFEADADGAVQRLWRHSNYSVKVR